MKNYHQHLDSDLEKVLEGVAADEAAELRKIWDASASGNDPVAFADESVDVMRQRVLGGMSRQITRPPVARRGHRAIPMRRVVPMLVVLAVTCLLGVLYLQRPVVVEAPLGEMVSVLLPDNSTVILNSGARLTYPRYWGEKRSAHLEGEAYFNIIKEEIPFFVSTFDADIEVLGTRFNVQAWEASAEPHTLPLRLLQGRITICSARREAGMKTEVVPGEVWQVQAGTHLERSERGRFCDCAGILVLAKGESSTFHNQPLHVQLWMHVERRYSTRLSNSIFQRC